MTVEFEILDPPTDGISSLHFSRHAPHQLLATSWDSTAYLYDCQSNLTVGKFALGAALLDGCFSARNSTVAYAAGLSRQIHRIDLGTGKTSNFGLHEDGIRALNHCPQSGLVFSGSWDRSVAGWDERETSETSGSIHSKPAVRLVLPDKVYSMDLCEDKHLLLVATAGRHIYLYDTRSPSQPLQKRESSLKYQTRTTRFFGSAGEGFICASIEGRVAVDFIDPNPEIQQNRYAFKCHRQPASTNDPQTGAPMEIVYPVNAVACHAQSNCFFTGGSDGVVNSWDRINRKRIRQFPKYSTGISALAIDLSGEKLAIGVSYSFEEGEKDHPPESIFIRNLEDTDIRSKSSSNASNNNTNNI